MLSDISFNDCWMNENVLIILPVETVGFFKHYVFNSISDFKGLSLMNTEERSTRATNLRKSKFPLQDSYLLLSDFNVW